MKSKQAVDLGSTSGVSPPGNANAFTELRDARDGAIGALDPAPPETVDNTLHFPRAADLNEVTDARLQARFPGRDASVHITRAAHDGSRRCTGGAQ